MKLKTPRLGSPWSWNASAWASIGLSCLIVADSAHLARVLTARNRSPVPVKEFKSAPRARIDLGPEIARAHLFGASPAALETTVDTRRTLLVSGIIATGNPQIGHSTIDPAAWGQPPRVYEVGAALKEAPQARIAQIFPDYVLLDFGDHREVLRLPGRRAAAVSTPLPQLAAAIPVDEENAVPGLDPTVVHPRLVQTPAETAFDGLNVGATPDGRIRLSPEPRVQRLYGLQDGDELVAVNGVSNPSTQTLQSLLESAPQQLSLVVMRHGASVMIDIPVD